MPVSSLIVGVDLVAIKAIRNVQTVVGDITTQKCRQDLRGLMRDFNADVYGSSCGESENDLMRVPT
jgi:AdoMet-dependent rRNA methyltransferase SPB1